MGAATCRAVTSHGRQCRYAGMFGAANVRRHGPTQRAKNLAPTPGHHGDGWNDYVVRVVGV